MADKKITELPFITDITASIGSSPSNTTVIPVVLYGTTNQITADNLKDNFIRNVRGTVKDIQTYTSSLKGAITVEGNGIEVAGNLEVQGNMSVKGTIFTQYETSSIIYTSGSTKFGNSFDDLHEFTGSVVSTGSYTINGEDYTFYSSSNSEVFTTFSSSNSTAITSFSSSNSTLFTNFSSSNSTVFTNYSSSESTLFTNFSSSNSSYNTTFSSSNETYVTALSSSNSSYNTTFSSSNSTYITALSSSNSSYNTTFSSSNATYVTALSSSNSSYNTTFSSSNSSYNTTFSSSNATYVTALSSSNSTTFTNYSSSTAGTINGLSSGVTNELNRVYQTTASLQDQTSSLLAFTASQVNRNTTLSIVTGSLNNFTASQDNRNFTLSQVTGSLIGITNGLMAFTASLDNTYATDAQLYQLYQATRSLELLSGSMIGVTNGLMAYTASNSTLNTGLRGEVDGIEAYTASLKGQAIVSSSTQVQNYDVFALNSNLYTSTGSLIGITNGLMAYTSSNETWKTGVRGEVNGLEAYTASLKAAAIVSSSTQITNYYKFAETASANTFYGTQTINGNLQLSSTSPLVYNAGNTNAMLFGFFDGSSIYGPYYQIFGSNYSNTTQRGSAEFVFDSRNGGYTGFNIAEFNGSTWLRKFRVSPSGAEVTGSFVVDGGITGSLMATNNVVSSSTQIENYDLFALNSNLYNSTGSIKGEIAGIEAYTASLKGAAIVSSSTQIQNYNLFAVTSSANTFYGNQTITGSLFISGSGGNPSQAVQIIRDTLGNGTTVEEANMALTILSAPGQTKLAMGASNAGNYGYIQVMQDATSWTNRSLTLQPRGGDVTISNGNLILGTSGKGIDFSATSNGSGTTSSELLNDYEEGTFTPVIAGGTSAGTATYTDQNGKYTKIGNCVYFRTDVIWSGHTGTGTLKITGLPFTIGQNYQSVGSVRFNQSGSANHYIAGGFIYQTQFELNQIPVGGGLPASFDITSAGDIRVSGHYFV